MSWINHDNQIFFRDGGRLRWRGFHPRRLRRRFAASYGFGVNRRERPGIQVENDASGILENIPFVASPPFDGCGEKDRS
jgi:hypothetical protein